MSQYPTDKRMGVNCPSGQVKIFGLLLWVIKIQTAYSGGYRVCVKRVLSSLGPWSGPAGRANPNMHGPDAPCSG